MRNKNRSILNILEVLGMVTVILSLLFVAYEINQANKIAMVDSEQAIWENFSAINELIMGNTEYAELMHKMTYEDAEFSDGDLEKVRAFVRRMTNVWSAAENSYISGMLTEQTYQLLYDDVRNLLITYPGSRKAWQELLDLYPNLTSGFFAYSRDLLNELELRDGLDNL
ncbi:hypothetical protein N9478_03455 [Gammaproteobacteria bacterium]|nr:hypothetical protein [Gammaproteobacteria bacterium]